MTEMNQPLPESVKHLELDGKQIYLVGTAHISKESVEDVHTTIEQIQPDSVCVELCQGRYNSIIQKDTWEKMNIFHVIKEKKAVFLLAQLIMTSFYRRLGKQFGVEPGAEMIEGVKMAEQSGANLVLADRNIEITLKRVWGYLGFWNKMLMFSNLIAGLLVHEDLDESTVEEMKQKDQLENALTEFAEKFPEVKKRLIDERDIYLAQKIRETQGNKIVAVVGAGHIPGIENHIQQENNLDKLMEIPPKSIWPTIFKWGIPALIVLLIAAGFFFKGKAHGTESILIWILVNGLSSAMGTIIALGHPLAVLAAFVGAPLTSLNPMVAAGFVAGGVQAWVKKPTVADFKRLPIDLETVKGFWMNPVIRILLVLVLANLGSMIGTWVAGFWIAGRTL